MDALASDEALVLLASCVLAATAIFRHLALLWHRPRRAPRSQLALLVVPLLALAAIDQVVARLSAREVRAQPLYRLLFDAVGVVWLAGAWKAMPLTGLSPRDDAFESGNRAAIVAVGGAWLGVGACYAGANVGEGPTIWTTLGPAALVTVLWFFLWILLELVAAPGEAIAIERDGASAWRLAGLLVANGMLLGAAAAGDWHSTAETVRFAASGGLPALVLTAVVAIAQRAWRPVPARPSPSVAREGLVPGILLVLAAAAWLRCR